MFNFTSFKSIISKDDISNSVIKLSSIERIFEDTYVFCQKVLASSQQKTLVLHLKLLE